MQSRQGLNRVLVTVTLFVVLAAGAWLAKSALDARAADAPGLPESVFELDRSSSSETQKWVSTTTVLCSDMQVLATVPISTSMGYVSGQELYPLAWSPDGKAAAYSWKDGIWIVQEPDYRPVLLVSIPDTQMGGVAWSPDGRRLALYGDQWLAEDELWGNFIWVVDADGANLQKLTGNPRLTRTDTKRSINGSTAGPW